MKEQKEIIDEKIDIANKEIKTNMRKNSICNSLTIMGNALTILAATPIILKMPDLVGASLYTGAFIVWSGVWIGIYSKKSDKYDQNIENRINELHEYALEENKQYKKEKNK